MASLSGTIWSDTIDNNIIDNPGDTPLQGWTVGIYTTGGLLVDTATTNVNGVYTFNVDQGQYLVQIIDADPSTGGNQSPSSLLYTYLIPNAPANNVNLPTLEPYYPVTLLDSGNQIGGTDFEDADSLLPAPVDDTLLTASNQVWEDIGFRFWEGSVGNAGIRIEERDRDGATPGSATADNADTFVNDLITGPFNVSNRLSNRQVDIEHPDYLGDMGNWVARGGGLYSQNVTPKMVIEYTYPTLGAEGWIWDIDGAYPSPSNNYNGSEEWTVKAYKENGDVITVVSPLGESAWVPKSDISANDANTFNGSKPDITYDNLIGSATELANSSLSADVKSAITGATWYNGGSIWDEWSYNPDSLDGKYWEWSFISNDGVFIDRVEIEYTGTKQDASNVGLAFDRFEAFGNPTDSANFLLDPPEPTEPQTVKIGDYVWYDTDCDGIQDSNESGVNGVTVKVYTVDANGNIIALYDTTTTNVGLQGNGYYEFEVDINTDYKVEFVLPSGYDGFSPANTTGDANDSDANPNGFTDVISVGTTNDFTIDAGLCREDIVYQGLTIGAWKNYYNNRNKGGANPRKYEATWGQIFDDYGFDPLTRYATAFELTSGETGLQSVLGSSYNTIASSDGNPSSVSLIDALNAKGNTSGQNFLRQSTAGLLNALHPDINYQYTVGQVRDWSQTIFDDLNLTNLNTWANDLDIANNAHNVSF